MTCCGARRRRSLQKELAGLVVEESECFFGQLHQRQVGRLEHRALGGQTRQHVGREELRRRHLAGVERLVLARVARVETSLRDLGLTQQQPAY